jgi:hypothetical protein
VRLHLNCEKARSWSEVDCVRLCGLLQVHWTKEVHRHFPRDFQAMVRAMLLVNARHAKERREMWLPEVMLYEIFTHAANLLTRHW